MKKFTKVFIVAICAILLVVGSVAGTLAYLTGTDTITNTFTVGKVNITLDEAKVDEYGTEEGGAARVKANTYKLIPGHAYKKDPVIHVEAGSENCYLFVKIENNIADVENNTIAAQLTANSWTLLSGNVYYHAPVNASASANDIDVAVFETFTVKAAATNAEISACNGKTIVVTAYAVQADGFDSAEAAWNTTFGAPAQP